MIELMPVFLSLSAVIIGWCFWRVFFSGRRFDFLTVFYLFGLFFFGVAPVIQMVDGLKLAPMYDEGLDVFDYILTDCVVLVVFVMFEFVYRRAHRFALQFAVASVRREYALRNFVLWLPVVAVAVYAFLWYQNFDVMNLLIRGGDGDVGRQEVSKLMDLVFGKSMRYIPISAALIYHTYRGKWLPLEISLWIAGLACCFPTGMARLQIVPLYLPVAMICFRWLRDRKRLLVSMMVAGILFVFPLLNGMRERDADADFSNYSFFDFSFFNKLHFDSFPSLAFVIKQDHVTDGEQLLGSLFFWVPRDLWPEKPIESGRMIAETYELGIDEFTNIAVNWLGEGYLNFGWIGVILWCVALAAVCGWWDARFWSDERNFGRKEAIYYFSGLGFLFFLLRGDMMNGVAFTMGLLASHFIMSVCMLRRMTSK